MRALVLAFAVAWLPAAEIAWKGQTVERIVGEDETDVTVRFPFTNIGVSPVAFEKADGHCGCIAADLVGDERIFPPGAVGELQVSFAAGASSGRFEKRIDVSFAVTDGPREAHQVRIVYQVRSPVIVPGKALFWDRGEARVAKTQTITVVDASFQISAARCDSPRVAVELQPADDGYLLRVTPLEDGAITATVVLETNSPHARFRELRVYALGL